MATTAESLAGAPPRSSQPTGNAELRALLDRRRSRQSGNHLNVGSSERIVSVAGGSILALLGAARRDWIGLLIASVGGGLVYRGATGRCPMYGALGIDTADQTAHRGIHVAESLLVDKPPEELYAYWRNLENLPRIMTHLESVQVMDDGRSHWIAKAPAIAGGEVEWDAEITADEPYSWIAWRSLPGSTVEHTGSVRFVRMPGERGTAIQVVMEYSPPAGRLGHWVAKMFGEAPDQQIHEDLRNFKRAMEVGEILTTAGQPHGSCLG